MLTIKLDKSAGKCSCQRIPLAVNLTGQNFFLSAVFSVFKAVSTVEPCSTDTRLIRTPVYSGSFVFPNEKIIYFLHKLLA